MKYTFLILILIHTYSCCAQKEVIKEIVDPIHSSVLYETVSIGKQQWMSQNLDVSRFQNGDTLFHAVSNQDWEKAGLEKTPAWCYFDNDSTSNTEMGKLYNWYAVNDGRNLAPLGYKIPAIEDWIELMDSLGGPKSAGIQLMDSINWVDGTGASGFNAFPGGGRGKQGTFSGKGGYGFWWTATDFHESAAYVVYLYNDQFWGKNGATKDGNPKEMGFTVRCLKID